MSLLIPVLFQNMTGMKTEIRIGLSIIGQERELKRK